jgi:hypothetical protein
MAGNKSKTPFYLIDTNSEFYRPLGVRLAICAGAVLWAVLETWFTDPFWSVIAIACAVYCVYVLFVAYKPPEPVVERPADPDEGDDSDGNDGVKP